jgi:hypothetical protein
LTESNNFIEALQALQNVINAAYKLAPSVVVTAIILAAIVAYVSLIFIEILQGFIVILIIFISILIYYKSNNYGEAALALVVGLLAAFTVNWSWNQYIVFMTALLGFLLFIMLVGSIKLAAEIENIYLKAAIHINAGRSKDISQQLKKISDSTATKKISPIEKAYAIKAMSFQNIPIESMKYMLKMVDMLSAIADMDAKYVTSFLIALSDALNISPGPSYEYEVDKLIRFYRYTKVSYEDFIRAFMNSYRLVIFGKVKDAEYRLLLRDALEKNVSPEETYDYISERIGDSFKPETSEED